ncbi:Bug family tripartite tricarboxylate transporter substrate binding protein [Variovorax fucosicus]|uniref:Bug family tripartite tricarboxylate transporter substrate binding protein n=1 Tax=Variovorax fucosicus TaxID=3053517 RepID=UPI002578AD04|nr:Bug family tripartite tricarboxylate transporter substrate binding protein [Variovorax sp. J22G47]MDM0056869.1 Bug family tripartite tricarboxylate transporter substrate binding protein [Variovorax sp. J22G47]
MPTRRKFTSQLAGIAALTATPLHYAHSQSIGLAKILVGFPPGGATDAVARRLAEKMRGGYANTVVVENKPGASMQISISTLKDSAPDGSTLLLSPTAPFSIYPFTYRKLPYVADDVAPVTSVCSFAFGFAVGPAVPPSVRGINDFIAWCKANPDKANFGSPASGSTPHLLGILLSKLSRTELTHVGYRGDAPGLQDLMGGQVSAYSSTVGSFLPHLKSGRLRLIAVSGQGRNAFVNDVPTFREQGYPINATESFGLFLPGRTSQDIVRRAAAYLHPILAQGEVVAALGDIGMTAKSGTPQDLANLIKADTDEWRRLIKIVGFTAES